MWTEADQNDGRAEGLLERLHDRDRATLANIDGRLAERLGERARSRGEDWFRGVRSPWLPTMECFDLDGDARRGDRMHVIRKRLFHLPIILIRNQAHGNLGHGPRR